jgi:hypothetical protein
MTAPQEYFWEFHIFRRHRPGDRQMLIDFIAEDPFINPFLTKLQTSADQGRCEGDCLACGGEIHGDAAFGGLCVLRPGFGNPQHFYALAPLCAPCAKSDIDILGTRCREKMAKMCFEGGKLEEVVIQ